MEHRGVQFTVGEIPSFSGVRWSIPQYDHLSRPISNLVSSGAFYDGEPDHPEGAYAWAEAMARRRIDQLLDGG